MPRSKASAFFSVLLVFASGAAMGAVGYRLYTVKSGAAAPTVSAAKKQSEEIRKRIVSRLKENIKLDDQQVTEVDKIYVDQFNAFTQIHDKYQAQIDEIPQINEIRRAGEHDRDQIHDQSVAKIKALLRPDQQPLYDKWLADRAADRARHQQEHKDHPDGGKQHQPLPPLP